MSSCTRPILAVDFGIDKETGKHKLRMLPKRVDTNITYYRRLYGDMLVLLPCGHCESCRASRSKDWANRCYLESLYHDKNYFITLTYDPAYCPDFLIKRHVQDFVKSLRNKGFDFRYFLCGEYGSQSGRPHYHMLAFGLDLTDLYFFGNSKKDSKMFCSDTLDEIWQKGFVSVCEMTPETICYTARYCTKKLGSNDYDKEFILMSRRPGIGSKWLSEHYKDLIDDQHLYLGEYGVKGLSRYIKEYIKRHDPEAYEKLSKEVKEKYADKLVSDRLKNHLSEELILDNTHEANIRRNLRKNRGNL